MRLFVDQNVPRAVVDILREDGHDVTWAQMSHPGDPDDILLEVAQTEERVLLTFDTDFGTLAFEKRAPGLVGDHPLSPHANGPNNRGPHRPRYTPLS